MAHNFEDISHYFTQLKLAMCHFLPFLSFRHTEKDKVRRSWLSGCFSQDLKTTLLGLGIKLSATHGKQTQHFRSGVRHLCPVNDPLTTYKGWQQSSPKVRPKFPESPLVGGCSMNTMKVMNYLTMLYVIICFGILFLTSLCLFHYLML